MNKEGHAWGLILQERHSVIILLEINQKTPDGRYLMGDVQQSHEMCVEVDFTMLVGLKLGPTIRQRNHRRRPCNGRAKNLLESTGDATDPARPVGPGLEGGG